MTEIRRNPVAKVSTETKDERKIEVAISDESLSGVIDAISKSANTGKVGDGKIFVSSLEDVIRIRTGEQGSDAV